MDFESGRDILNLMSGGIHAKQEKITLTNNSKLQNPWKYSIIIVVFIILYRVFETRIFKSRYS